MRRLGEALLGARSPRTCSWSARLGAYGTRMVRAALPHGPVELAAYALALALYLQGRAARSRPTRARGRGASASCARGRRAAGDVRERMRPGGCWSACCWSPAGSAPSCWCSGTLRSTAAPVSVSPPALTLPVAGTPTARDRRIHASRALGRVAAPAPDLAPQLSSGSGGSFALLVRVGLESSAGVAADRRAVARCWSRVACGAGAGARTSSTSFTSPRTIRPRRRTSRTWSSRSRTSSACGRPSGPATASHTSRSS